VNIPHIHFCIDIQKSTDNIGSYIVVNPSEENWVDIAFLAPTLCANNLLEIAVNF
jgi:Icc-related predicted phosphoesterase